MHLRSGMDMKSGFRIATVRKIPIRIHPTFLLILPLFAYVFGRDLTAAAAHAGIPVQKLGFNPWLYGFGVALALFASVLVHELAHSLYAVRKGGRVIEITLLPIGGVSQMAEPPKQPGQEAMMALVGPATSLALGGIFLALNQAARPLHNFDLTFALFYLGYLNISLGLFNLAPAFPMDGGRILRGLLARKKGQVRATQIAASLGKAFAALFGAFGFVSGNLILLLIAFFIVVGAEAEERMVLVSAVLGDVRVREMMTSGPDPVGATEMLSDVGERMIHERRVVFPVVDDGHVVGVLTAEAVEGVAAEKRRVSCAREAVVESAVVDAGDRALDALRKLDERHAPCLAVTEEGRLTGMLGRTELAEGIRLRELERALHGPFTEPGRAEVASTAGPERDVPAHI